MSQKKYKVRKLRQHRPMRKFNPGDLNEITWNKPDRPRLPDDAESFEENWDGIDWGKNRETCEKTTKTTCGTMSVTTYRRK